MFSPRALLLDVKLPRPDRDAASLRTVQVLAHLADRAHVDLAVISDYGAGDAAGTQAAALGANLVAAGGAGAIEDHLRRHGPDYDLIVFCWSRTATAFMTAARRAAPRAGLIFDTVDVNHVREFRHARATGNARRLQIALAIRDQEVAAMCAADCTIAITETDRSVLAALAPQARIAVAGIWIDTPPPASARRVDPPQVLFIGHYQAAPNHDAALLLAHEILPIVHRTRPEVRLVLAGSEPSEPIQALAAATIDVPGWEADLAARLATASLFVAPLRFGSGLKGKILQAMAHSVPIIASAVAIEGTGLRPDHDCLVANTAAETAASILILLDDPTRAARLATNALVQLHAHFSRGAVNRQFEAIFDPYLRVRANRPHHATIA